jgi:LPS-assembly lipoprotein
MRFRILMLCLALAGCGFQPLYGQRDTGPSIQEQLAKVRIGEIRTHPPEGLRDFKDFRIEESRSRQLLRNALLDDLAPRGAVGRGEYVLDIRLIEPRTNLAIDRSDTTVRYGYSIVAQFTLRDPTGRVVVNSGSSSSTNFEVSSSEFATIWSQRDARDRIIQEISSDIRNQLAVYFLARTQAKTPSQ